MTTKYVIDGKEYFVYEADKKSKIQSKNAKKLWANKTSEERSAEMRKRRLMGIERKKRLLDKVDIEV